MASDAKDEVRALLKRINQAWLNGSPENLASTLNECFSEAIAFAGPAFQVVARGRDACIKGYADFIRAAKIDHCQLSDPVIEVWDGTAVAFYKWEMVYTMEDQQHQESGHDVFVFACAAGKWRAVWRALLVSQ